MEEINYALVFKALGDDVRVKIFNMLKEKSLCACKILEAFKITQPTLSYHMKIMCESGLVDVVKNGIWNHYSIKKETVDKINLFFKDIK